MKSTLLLLCLSLSLTFSAQIGHEHDHSHEVRFIKAQEMAPSISGQSALLQGAAWSTFSEAHPQWSVLFDERSGMPQRAFGPGIPTTGSTIEQRAMGFIDSALSPFSLPVAGLSLQSTVSNGTHHILFFSQEHDGMEVLNSRLMVKMTLDGKVISWKADVHNEIALTEESIISPDVAITIASSTLTNIEESSMEEGLFILPIPTATGYDYAKVYHTHISGSAENGVPYRYFCLVDAESGMLHYRSNEIHAYADCGHGHAVDSNCSEPPMAIDLQLTADTWVTDPSEPMEERPLAGIRIDIDGTQYQCDEEGMLSAPITGPTTGIVFFEGNFADVLLNGSTPSFTVDLQEGDTIISANGEIAQEAISGFLNTNTIHDYMKTVLPDFNGMDFALPVNIGITPHDCNAYYDGYSINFFVEANSCVSLVNVADVVYHEYGHGINRTYYEDFGAFFNNGAMGEGYSDVWAFAVNEDPLLGDGLNPQNPNDLVRRYDIDPKVYPQDLVGQVHADGEIIAGAWWDTYLALGSDMEYTMQVFASAYGGLQAQAFNGDEGEAYFDVLVDALEGDDDDGDLSNGSPNGEAIIAAFDIHGITLQSVVALDHDVVDYLPSGEGLLFTAEADVSGLYNSTIGSVFLHYRTSSDEGYQEVIMSDGGDGEYEVEIAGMPVGTIIDYYLTATVSDGELAGVLPARVLDDQPVLPYFSLVGYELVLEDDNDGNETFTDWQLGLPSDEADTGEWEVDSPIATTIDGGIVAPGTQTTVGGSSCFITGNANNNDEAAGVNDIDAGTVTLISGVIDLAVYDDPVIEYHRWYTNNTGANPNADWWQVQVSDDGGDNWEYVENTMVSQTEWRKNMFRISDYVDVTDLFMIKFNASDSLRPGQPQDGGSLVEAAVDDIRLHDSEQPPVSVQEVDILQPLSIYPNPSTDRIMLTADSKSPLDGTLRMYDATGKEIASHRLSSVAQFEMDVSGLAEGVYTLKLGSVGRASFVGTFVKQ